MKKFFCLALSTLLILLLFLESFPAVVYASESDHAFFSGSNSSSYLNGSDKLRDTLYAIKDLDSSFFSDYVGFSSLKGKVNAFLAVSSPSDSEVAEIVAEINPFLNWVRNLLDSSRDLLSVAFKKIGVFYRDLDDYLDFLLTSPEFLPSIGEGLLKIGVRENWQQGSLMPRPDNDRYTFNNKLLESLYLSSKNYVDEESSDFFILIDTITFEEFYDYVDGLNLYDQSDVPKGGCRVIKSRIQDCYDYFNNEDILYFFRLEFSTYNGHSYPNFVAAYGCTGDVYAELQVNNVYRQISPNYLSYISFHSNYSSIYTGTGSGVTKSTTEFLGRTYPTHFVTKDGRTVLIYKSLSIYNSLHDWSNGCPYSVLTSDSFNSYSSVDDHSFTVLGSVVNDSSVENDYSSIVSNVISGNDYSSSVVNTVINNYYSTNPVPGEDPSLPDDPNDSGDFSISGFINGLRSFLGGILDLVGGLLGIIGDLLSGFMAILNNLTSFSDDFGIFLKTGLTFLPEDAIAVIVAGISAVIVISVIRFLRG